MDAAQAYPKAGGFPAVPVALRIHAGRMQIHDWPAHERPRERLLAGGPAQLSDAELLAIFLGSGLRGQDAVATARDLLARHGPLRELLERGPAEMMKLPGLGPARACRLSAALELCNRYLAAGLERGEALSDPHAAGRYFAQRLRGQPQEVFACLFLDARHRALAFEPLFHGTVDGAEVHPREVVRRALAHNAAAVIAGHNHPRGNPEPSAADRAVTALLTQSLALVDVRLLDHFVIGDGPPSSMAARGWV
jgi:DNA repair protein RadC